MKESRGQRWLGLGVASAVLCGALWDWYPLPDARPRLAEVPKQGSRFQSRDVPLTEREKAVLGGVAVLHRSYRFETREFYLTLVDGTEDRHAVHDPRYCFQGAGWRIAAAKQVAIPGGEATWLTLKKADVQLEAVFWFSDGASRHSSFPRYWGQTTLRRITLGGSGSEPVLVLLQLYENAPSQWSDFLKELVGVLKL